MVTISSRGLTCCVSASSSLSMDWVTTSSSEPMGCVGSPSLFLIGWKRGNLKAARRSVLRVSSKLARFSVAEDCPADGKGRPHAVQYFAVQRSGSAQFGQHIVPTAYPPLKRTSPSLKVYEKEWPFVNVNRGFTRNLRPVQ